MTGAPGPAAVVPRAPREMSYLRLVAQGLVSATASPGRRLLARIVPKSMVGGRFTEA